MSLACLLWSAAPAAADEQPSTVKAYGLDWVQRVKEEAWLQPRAERPVICLLDTGVAVTPDTPADDPQGPIVARLSVEDPLRTKSPSEAAQLALPQGTSFEHLRGTRMASVIGAGRNGYGTVGVFPQARIVSVRATVGNETFIHPADLIGGARLCARWALGAGVRLAAVVGTELNYTQRDDTALYWETAANAVRARGGQFVAAVGNEPDAQTSPPLTVSNVLSVGAADSAGQRCPFAPERQEGAIFGPGCDVAGAGWPAGSSSAAAVAGAMLGVLATRFPMSSSDSQRETFIAAAKAGSSGLRRLDGQSIRGLFDGLIAEEPAPLGPVVPETPPLAPAQPELASTGPIGTDDRRPPASAARPAKTEKFRPRVKVRWAAGRLHVRRLDQHRAGVLCALVDTDEVDAEPTCGGRRVSVKLARRPHRVKVWVESKDRQEWRSRSSWVRVPRR